jgi:hypothetical protein
MFGTCFSQRIVLQAGWQARWSHSECHPSLPTAYGPRDGLVLLVPRIDAIAHSRHELTVMPVACWQLANWAFQNASTNDRWISLLRY